MKTLQEIVVPQETVNDEFVTIVKIHFKNGDHVNSGDTHVEMETSKTVFSVEAEVTGYIEYFCEEWDNVETGKTIINIYDEAPSNSKKEKVKASDHVTKAALPEVDTRFSKKALALIKKQKVDRNSFKGKDFVTEHDVQKLIDPAVTTVKSPVVQKPAPEKIDADKVLLEKLSPQKSREIDYLSHVQSAGLNSVVNVFVNTENIFDFIGDTNEVFKKSLLPIVVYEVSMLLKKHKEVNAFFAGDSIAYYNDVHIGVAVDVDDGLKVLKLPYADKKGIKNIEKELIEVLNKYLEKRLASDDLTGTTFTITDLSTEKASFFTPLINKEQSAILGVSDIDKKLNRAVLTLTFDHRGGDVKKACRVLNKLKKRIDSYRGSGGNETASAKKTGSLKCSNCLKTLDEDNKLQNIGLIRIVNHMGEDALICHACFSGF